MPNAIQNTERPNEYNGWTNYETWNVALYINNDESLQNIGIEIVEMCDEANESNYYEQFAEYLRENFEITETPDQVAYNDSSLDEDELNEMLKENHSELS